jgi:hypothetical protein
MKRDPMQVRLRKVAITHFDAAHGSGHAETWQLTVDFPAGTGVLVEGENKLVVLDAGLARVEGMLGKMREMRRLNEEP